DRRRADRNPITIAQPLSLRHLLAVYQCAVGRTEILDRDLGVVRTDTGVPAGRPVVEDADIRMLVAPDDEVAIDSEYPTGSGAGQHDQIRDLVLWASWESSGVRNLRVVRRIPSDLRHDAEKATADGAPASASRVCSRKFICSES